MTVTTARPGPSYTLVGASAVAAAPPVLDEAQRAVVEHPGGPLLVLAGPGTGKTTTLVEAIADRIERRGVAPESILALTFSRKAAEQLRDRVTARLGRTLATSLSSTFHSFAYGLIRGYTPDDLYDGPMRLLSAPEQDVVLQELLRDHPESVAWPPGLARAIGTRGFAHEVQSVLSRAREKGLDGPALTRIGLEGDLPEFVAAGLFLDQYLQILDNLGATDYADLIRRAVIEAEAHREELRRRFTHVFVDEYQDTDPGQVALLRALAGDGRNLVVVGDPHQSIYAFRGAEVRGILEFPTAFPKGSGEPADVVALRTTRRFGPRLLLATQRVAARLTLAGSIDARAREAFLAPVADGGDQGPGRVEVLTFDSERAEAEHLADLLRRAHIEDGIAWSAMAVLVRSGRATIPGLRRSLGAAGVPVEVAADETPLVREPSVLPLLEALRAVLHLGSAEPDPADHRPDDLNRIDANRAEALLLSPLGGLDAGDLRRLSRALLVREKARAAAEDRAPRASRELLQSALLAPGLLDGVELPEAARVRALGRLLRHARALLERGGSAEEVLWALWSGTGWPERLRRTAESGGAAARRAHRDLDAVCALFDAAARAEEQRDHAGVRNFLATIAAHRIPADTLAERGVRGDAVRLLTAHRAKGLEWRLVVVAHVQEDGWPDLRRRASLLEADRIGEDGLQPPVTPRELLMEERRLFYVACTRARQRLVVTAVASGDDEGEQPSRFLAELGVHPEHRQGRPRRPLSMAGLVAELRRTLADPDTSEALRAAAARRLAQLASEHVEGRPLVPQADPGSWWGTRAASRSAQPIRDPDQPVPVSATVLQSVLTCPMHWFLEREAGGAERSSQAAGLGQLVHSLADRVARGELTAGPGDLEVLMAHVDRVWDRLEFRTPWSRAREHTRVRQALQRFLDWHYAPGRTLLATERGFAAVVTLPGGEQVRLSGYADRLELDGDGRVVVVDLKTDKRPPSGKAVARHPQLALYQLAVDHGAVDDLLGHPARSGGAELVQLGAVEGRAAAQVQRQPRHEDGGPERVELQAALFQTAVTLRSETFPAVAGQHCRLCTFQAICPAKSAGTVLSQ